MKSGSLCMKQVKDLISYEQIICKRGRKSKFVFECVPAHFYAQDCRSEKDTVNPSFTVTLYGMPPGLKILSVMSWPILIVNSNRSI